MSGVSRSNNDACVCLSHFVGRCRIIVRRLMLGWNEYISRGSGSGYLQCPHTVSLVESRGKTVTI